MGGGLRVLGIWAESRILIIIITIIAIIIVIVIMIMIIIIIEPSTIRTGLSGYSFYRESSSTLAGLIRCWALGPWGLGFRV